MSYRKYLEDSDNYREDSCQSTAYSPMDFEEDLPFLPESMKRSRNSEKQVSEKQILEEQTISDEGESHQRQVFINVSTEHDPVIQIDEIESSEAFSERKYIVLIIYDIISNKQRVKMAKLLSSYGNRVQKSAFEARLNKKQYARLLRDIKKLMKKDDNVRIYKLHSYEEILTFGEKKYEIVEDVIII